VVPAEETLARAVQEATRLGALAKHAFRATKTRLRGRTIAMIRDGMADDVKNLLPGP